jgi:citronellol/citronellal dehydrogenase
MAGSLPPVPELLRPEVLQDVTICVDGEAPAVRARLAALGATVVDRPVERADVLVADAAGAFTRAGGALPGLRAALDGAWDAVREVATACWVGEGRGTGGGKIVLLAPPAGAGEHAAAVGAALENLARTLSVEWARFGVRIVAIRAASASTDEEVAELVAFLASHAGEYYSGATFSLTG